MKLKYRFLKIGICLSVLILMLSFSIKRFNNSTVKDIRIDIKDSVYLGFIDDNKIMNDFIAMYDVPENVKINQINVHEIENNLAQNPYADSVNVYLDQDRNLNFYVTQKEPIIRVNNDYKGFYITKEGTKIPISQNFSKVCMMVEGNITEEDIPQLIELKQVIDEDKLLTKHIVGVKKLRDNSFILLVNVDDFYIELGDLEDTKDKMKNLRAFYDQYLKHVGSSKYSKISLKYKNQIVATKK